MTFADLRVSAGKGEGVQLITATKPSRLRFSLEEMYTVEVGLIKVAEAEGDPITASSASSFAIRLGASSSFVFRRRSLFFQNTGGVRPWLQAS